MAKKNFGLESLLQPTTTSQQSDEKEKMVNSNIPLKQSQHAKLRILAFQKGISLKELFTQMIDDYLEKNNE